MIDVLKLTPPLLFSTMLLREAENQKYHAILAAAISVRNRVQRPMWWGHDWRSVILCHDQYSSFNPGNPRETVFLRGDEISFLCRGIAQSVYDGEVEDTIGGADSYFDRSIDKNPPAWAAKLEFVKNVGDFHFYRTPRAISA